MTSDNQIEISFIRITEPFPENVYGLYLSKLPKALRMQNQRFIRWQDRHAHLMGKMLLLRSSVRLGTGARVLHDLVYNTYGKPSVNYLNFNISHAGEFVVCACAKSNARLGIDIERKKPVPFSDFVNTMDDKQWEEINRDPERALDVFYRYWTIKESVIKAIGQGLSFPLTDITIGKTSAMVNGATSVWHLAEFSFHPEYAMAIVTDVEDAAKHITLKEFRVGEGLED